MKKLFLYIGLFFGLFFFQNCSQKIIPFSAEVNFLNKDAQGTIEVISFGYGSDFESAIIDAEKNAFKVLLFRGIPGTELNVPLINNELEAKTKNKEYFNNFFEEGYYKTFIMTSNVSSDLIKLKGSKKLSVNLKINYNSLRKNMEQNNIIKKFGF
jgi:hypothetical protein